MEKLKNNGDAHRRDARDPHRRRPDTVRRTIGYVQRRRPAASMEELKVVYNQTFGYWSDKNYENGDVARWIDNAERGCRA